MKNIYWIILLGSISVLSCKKKEPVAPISVVSTEEHQGVALDVDKEASVINWKGFSPDHIHQGTVKLSEGILSIKDDKLALGGFTIDMNSIVCTDIVKESENKKLITHLKRGDFFYVDRFPDAKFNVTRTEEIDDPDFTHRITGMLELKGLERGVTFRAKITKNGNDYKAESESFKINRTNWGIVFGSNTVYDAMQTSMVEDYIEIQVVIVAHAQE